ncbi:response regulator receiver protein (plasmid) [Gloeothece citriformis PCC 7424]|uniref:Response regulator receiver protein n=1 Tax=Gloeothece citriformis (strain PCC 7424) TaxID=65393 RepID=B7KLT4_GLOC7|nr:transcriptional regulator [Gloeothece citriformis]ACK73756.1 response regulator receiver protein [Gloeothece citriformis PCC 7424]
MTLKILIVDSEIQQRREDYLNLFARGIKLGWYSLEWAASGEEGLGLIKADLAQEIALIVLDLQIDDGVVDGVDFANRLAELHIDKKLIIYTACTEGEAGLSEKAKRNVVTVVRQTEQHPRVIVDLVNILVVGQGAQMIEVAGDFTVDKKSRAIGYPTIRKLVKTLPAHYRKQMINEILPFFPPKILLELKQEIPQIVDELIQESYDRDLLKQWVAKQQKAKLLSSDIPPAIEVDDFHIQVLEKRRKEGYIYYDYYLSWSVDGKSDRKYLRKPLLKTLPPQIYQPTGAPGDSRVVFKYPQGDK